MSPDILMLTSSYDVTSDVMLDFLGSDSVFRWNIDLWSNYQLLWNAEGFEIRDPSGRRIRDSDISALYWRKIATPDDDLAVGSKAAWSAAQRRYIIREVLNLLDRPDVARLVEPYAERRIGKVTQMRIASEFFTVPDWKICLGMPLVPSDKRWLAKALVMEPLGNDKFLYATEVSPECLAESETWFLQERVETSADVTVVYVDGDCFAFECLRQPGVDDWRQEMSATNHWKETNFRDETEVTIAFMDTLRLRFGRLDFVRDLEGRLWFLEVNPNGQFAWLDVHGEAGLMESVATAVRRASLTYARQAIFSSGVDDP